HVERLEHGELLRVLGDELGEPKQDALAPLRRASRPDSRLERTPRRPNGAVDVVGVAGRDLRDHPSRGRVDAREGLAAYRIDVVAADERTRAQIGHVGAPASSGSRTTIVRAPLALRTRSRASSTPSRSVKWETTPARSSTPSRASAARRGSAAATF